MSFLQRIFEPPAVQVHPPMPEINTVLTQAAVDAIINGKFPTIPVHRLVLRNGEKCLYCDYAVKIIEKLRVIGYRSRGHGGYVRLFRCVGLHTGDGARAAVRDNVQEYVKGKLYITNKRVIFSADKGSFTKSIAGLVSFAEDNGNLVLQFSNMSCKLYLQTLHCAVRVLEYIL